MSIFKGVGIGLKTYGKAIELIFSKGLWWYFLFPVLLNLILFIGGIYGIGSVANYVEQYLSNLANLDTAAFWGAVYLKSLMSGVLWVLFKFIFFIVFATFGGYIVIIVLSPVFAILSEKTEEILTGNNYPFNGDQLMRDIVRGIFIALRNMLIEFGFLILFFIIGFIPVIGQFATVVLFFISAYFYGFAFIDYTNERRRLTISESIQFMRKNKGIVIGNGSVFALAMLIPICGTTIAGFVAIVSVVAATIATHQIVNLSSNPYANKLEGDSEKA
ncbi:MAG: EI24 domain-containing protein [Vicingus serpentipes]|nr:EI24 domain-containing protein [Vicingus serpentipes]